MLKVSYGHLSAILTGDATGATTSHILAMAEWKAYVQKRANGANLENFDSILGVNELQSNILQASHHGSNTEGSNNEAWFKTINPQFIICSSGKQGRYAHPHYHILERAYKIPGGRLKYREKQHPFHCGKTPNNIADNNLGNLLFKYKEDAAEGYKIMQTTYGFYNTIDSGTILFTWKKNDKRLKTPTFPIL